MIWKLILIVNAIPVEVSHNFASLAECEGAARYSVEHKLERYVYPPSVHWFCVGGTSARNE